MKQRLLEVFAPLKDEPLWYISLKGQKRQLAFPRTDGPNMDFFLAKPEDLIPSWDLGLCLLVPAQDALKVIPDILLIPGPCLQSRWGQTRKRKRIFLIAI